MSIISLTSYTLLKLCSGCPNTLKKSLYVSAFCSIFLKFLSAFSSSWIFPCINKLFSSTDLVASNVINFGSFKGSRICWVFLFNFGIESFSKELYNLSWLLFKLSLSASHVVFNWNFLLLSISNILTSSVVIFSKPLFFSIFTIVNIEFNFLSLISYHISKTSFAFVFSKKLLSSMISPDIFENISSIHASVSWARLCNLSGYFNFKKSITEFWAVRSSCLNPSSKFSLIIPISSSNGTYFSITFFAFSL